MQLKLIITNDDLFFKSCKYFPKKYLTNLLFKPFFKESIISRYFISNMIWNNYLVNVDKKWIPIFDNKYKFSISHKKGVVFIWVSKENLWLDLEIFKERDLSLLVNFYDKEYNILWEKNWINFYILWTANESIIKYNLDDNYYKWKYILYKQEDILEIIDWIKFTKKLSLKSNYWVYEVYSWRQNNYIYSIIWK